MQTESTTTTDDEAREATMRFKQAGIALLAAHEKYMDVCDNNPDDERLNELAEARDNAHESAGTAFAALKEPVYAVTRNERVIFITLNEKDVLDFLDMAAAAGTSEFSAERVDVTEHWLRTPDINRMRNYGAMLDHWDRVLAPFRNKENK